MHKSFIPYEKIAVVFYRESLRSGCCIAYKTVAIDDLSQVMIERTDGKVVHLHLVPFPKDIKRDNVFVLCMLEDIDTNDDDLMRYLGAIMLKAVQGPRNHELKLFTDKKIVVFRYFRRKLVDYVVYDEGQ